MITGARQLILRPIFRRPLLSASRWSSTENGDDGGGKEKSLARKSDLSSVKVEKAKNFEVTENYADPQQLHKEQYFKPLESSYVANRPIQDPVKRTFDILTGSKKTKFLKKDFLAYYDVVIIGGGIIGCSIAYFLANRIHDQLKILVIERDPSYRHCSSTLSLGGLRQQFSLPENVEMSLYGADFLRHANRLLYCDGIDPPNIKFNPQGYLFLASEEGVETMQENHRMQIDCGAKVELMTQKRLKRRFPWLNLDGVAMGSYGYENEGWFDPWQLLLGFRLKAQELGVDFCHGDVYNFVHRLDNKNYAPWQELTSEQEISEELRQMRNRILEVHVHLPDGDVFPINSGIFVIAAGAQSGHIANMASIGCGDEELRVPLPVEPMKRYVYSFHAPEGPGLSTPLVVDPSSFYFRREGHGNNYLCGMSPDPDKEPPTDNNDVDFDYFDSEIWPKMAKRVKAFENLKVTGAWAGFYDYNTWDQNAIIGNHPHHTNLYFATGCSGHGIQQAPAIGRAIMELIIDAEFQTIDLSRFSFDRILNDEFVLERNIV